MSQYTFISLAGSAGVIDDSAINFRGTWDSASTYEPLDSVNNNSGRNFLALVENTNEPPPSNFTIDVPTVWSPLIGISAPVSDAHPATEHIVLDSTATEVMIAPNSSKTLVTFNGTVAQGTVMSCDTSRCQLGDVLMVFIQPPQPPNSDNTILFTFNLDQFFMTHCGGMTDNNTDQINQYERWMWNFVFDGTKYLDTFDNC